MTYNNDQNWKIEKKFIFFQWRFDTHEHIQANAHSGFDNNSEIWNIM